MKDKIRYQIVLFLVLIAAGFFCSEAGSQEFQKKTLRQSAVDNFNKGSFEQAYREFSILLETYPKDPLYKYYSSICLINLKRDPGKAVVLLQDALNGSLDIKSIPNDSWFYLGRAQQMSGNFAEAIKSFDHFTDIAGKRAAREMDVPAYIKECTEGKGQIVEKASFFADAIARSEDSVAKVNSLENKTVNDNESEQASKQMPVREVLPHDYDKLLSEALYYQVKADSLNGLAARHKEEFNSLPASQKPIVKGKIDDLESEASKYQKLADERFKNSETRSVLSKDSVAKKITTPDVSRPAVDTGQNKEEEAVNTTVPDKQEISRERQAVFSEFEIVTDLKTLSDQTIPTDPKLPPGLIYRIQIAVFSKPPANSVFKGITPVAGFTVPGTPTVKYYAGMFRRLTDANNALLAVKKSGFRDAFLNAVYDGKIISLDRAALLEKEWGNKPLYEVQLPARKDPAETGPPTLSFRVEVIRSPKPLKDDIVDTYRKLAAGKGLEILLTEDGSVAYLIGKFITFESANEYAGLLIRNGYRNARVVAYLGIKELPVETAKQLLERIK